MVWRIVGAEPLPSPAGGASANPLSFEGIEPTERKHLPDLDVAAAGGWKDIQSLKSAYQQADTETMLRVVLKADELREVR